MFGKLFNNKVKNMDKPGEPDTEKAVCTGAPGSDLAEAKSHEGMEATLKEADINSDNDEEEYELVEIEISPNRIICPDCGGITLEGLEFCDKCGGELQ